MALALTVGGVSVLPWLTPGSVRMEDNVNERSVLSFTLTGDSDHLPVIRPGDPVLCSVDGTAIFGGTVDDIPQTRVAWATASDGATLQLQVSCVDWTQLCDRLLVAGAYEDTTAEDILRDIWADYLEDEGVTLGTLAGLDETVSQAVFNYVSVSTALNALAEKTGCYWMLSPVKILTMVPRDEVVAPWAVTATAAVHDVQLRRHREEYRNRQYVTGASAETSEQTEKFVGDGTVRAFTLGYPVAQEPTILRGGVAQTVGLRTEQTTATDDWLWEKGDAILTQGREEGVTTWPVAGAGTAAYDGDYEQDGSFYGKACFTDGTYWLYWGDAAGVWLLDSAKTNHVDPALAAYYGTGTSLPGTPWTAGTGAADAPTVGLSVTVYAVTTAGSAGFNGTYRLAGTFGSKSYYAIDDDGPFIFWGDTCGEWLMDATKTDYATKGLAAYYGTYDSLPAGNWTKGTGATGNPTVAAATEVGPNDTDNTTLSATETLTVTYIGSFDLVLQMDDAEQVTQRIAAEGGTGVYAHNEKLSGQWTLESLVTQLENNLRRYGEMGETLTFGTHTTGLAAGQLLTVTLPEHNFEDEVLITAVALQELAPGRYGWEVSAVTGEAVGGWQEFFRRWGNLGTIDNLLDGSPETVITASDVFVKIWPDSEHPNPFYRLVPGAAVLPAATLHPQFEPRHEVLYMAVFEGIDNEVYRHKVTSLYRYDTDEIGTMTLLGPGDYSGTMTHLAWYGGSEATSTLGTGVLIEKVAYAETKSALQGILFRRRDLDMGLLDYKSILSGGAWSDVDGWGIHPTAELIGGDYPPVT